MKKFRNNSHYNPNDRIGQMAKELALSFYMNKGDGMIGVLDDEILKAVRRKANDIKPLKPIVPSNTGNPEGYNEGYQNAQYRPEDQDMGGSREDERLAALNDPILYPPIEASPAQTTATPYAQGNALKPRQGPGVIGKIANCTGLTDKYGDYESVGQYVVELGDDVDRSSFLAKKSLDGLVKSIMDELYYRFGKDMFWLTDGEIQKALGFEKGDVPEGAVEVEDQVQPVATVSTVSAPASTPVVGRTGNLSTSKNTVRPRTITDNPITPESPYGSQETEDEITDYNGAASALGGTGLAAYLYGTGSNIVNSANTQQAIMAAKQAVPVAEKVASGAQEVLKNAEFLEKLRTANLPQMTGPGISEDLLSARNAVSTAEGGIGTAKQLVNTLEDAVEPIKNVATRVGPAVGAAGGWLARMAPSLLADVGTVGTVGTLGSVAAAGAAGYGMGRFADEYIPGVHRLADWTIGNLANKIEGVPTETWPETGQDNVPTTATDVARSAGSVIGPVVSSFMSGAEDSGKPGKPGASKPKKSIHNFALSISNEVYEQKGEGMVGMTDYDILKMLGYRK